MNKKYSESGGVTHPYCGKGHAELAKKMNIKREYICGPEYIYNPVYASTEVGVPSPLPASLELKLIHYIYSCTAIQTAL